MCVPVLCMTDLHPHSVNIKEVKWEAIYTTWMSEVKAEFEALSFGE